MRTRLISRRGAIGAAVGALAALAVPKLSEPRAACGAAVPPPAEPREGDAQVVRTFDRFDRLIQVIHPVKPRWQRTTYYF